MQTLIKYVNKEELNCFSYLRMLFKHRDRYSADIYSKECATLRHVKYLID